MDHRKNEFNHKEQSPPLEAYENDGLRLRKLLRDVLETIVLAVLLFLLINAVSARIRVESISMEDTLVIGDFVLVDRISYQLSSPKRGDIIVFRFPPDPTQRYIKRIIGVPGDQITISDAKVMVNEMILEENYVKALPTYNGDWTVPESSFFVLGDNRNRSNDSHIWGMVPAENIIGRALLIYWPLHRIKTLMLN